LTRPSHQTLRPRTTIPLPGRRHNAKPRRKIFGWIKSGRVNKPKTTANAKKSDTRKKAEVEAEAEAENTAGPSQSPAEASEPQEFSEDEVCEDVMNLFDLVVWAVLEILEAF
jgi:hypothetical protein